jgi:hypothetical protein
MTNAQQSAAECDRRSVCRYEILDNLRLAAFHADIAAEYAFAADDAGCDYSLRKAVIYIKAALLAQKERRGSASHPPKIGSSA